MLTREERLVVEDALLELSANGDREARRNLLELVIQAMRSGEVISPRVRVWLVDGLSLIGEAIDTRERVSVAKKEAFGFFGARARGRPSDDDAAMNDLEIAAAVQQLQPTVNKTKAVAAVAEAVGRSEEEVWRACEDVYDWNDQAAMAALARPVIERLKVACSRGRYSFCQELVDFLTVT